MYLLERLEILARCVLHALARRERSDRAPRRLLEENLATWNQFKGNLELNHLLALVAEDAALRFPLPADPRRVLGPETTRGFTDVKSTRVYQWMLDLTPERLDAPVAEALAGYARALGLPHRFAGSDLHKLQAPTRVLELPGSGGQLVARALERSPDAWLHTNCTVLTGSWAERALAGLVAMELDAPGVDFVHDDDARLAWATEKTRRDRFDLVFGLKPERLDAGPKWDERTLAARFPAATVVLV